MLKKLKKKAILLAVLSYFSLIGFLFVISNTSRASAQTTSKDAIAIRIIPNPNNYSPERWYKENKFKGSPQSLIVDGYEAIRDGRSVYVGAANVDDKGTVATDDDILYTNIYLISFNQDSEQATRDIFSQIISHWKFNTNITTPGTCLAASPLDEDPSDSPVCILDSDCKLKQYCNSSKSEVIRDVKRLSDLVEIKIALDSYKADKGYYPKLNAGSYLANRTISTWPSWQKLLSQELNTDLPLDPINKLGECDARFYPITCWDEKAKEFADSDLSDPALNLPVGSKSYVYSVEPDGLSYNICGAMESDYVEGVGSGACSSAGTIEIAQSGINNPPVFFDQNLIGYAGTEFKGFIMAKDADGDALSWTINTLSTDWSSWSNPPILQNQPTPNQIGLYAAQAGDTDIYPIQVEITDGIHTVSKVFTIQVLNMPPSVSTVNSTVVVGYDLVPMIFTATDNEGHDIILNIGNILPVGLTGTQVNNTYEIVGIPTGSTPQTYTHNNQIIATDEYGAVTSKNFYITIVNNRPLINPVNCVSTVRTGDYYECQVTASDSDGHDFSFSMNSGPASLSINPNTGLISGTLGGGDEGIYSLNVIAADEYNAISLTKIIVLNVLNFCGDGELQKPNTEYKGGPIDDGFEQCDGAAGLAINPADSSVTRQYACTTVSPPAGTECVEGASCLGTCMFADGYCGDGILQGGYGEQCDDGNTVDGDGCNTANSGCQFFCGDNVCNGTESCGTCLDCGLIHDNDSDSLMACEDNCPDVFNPGQEDSDGDGIGDMCDLCYEYPPGSGKCVTLTITQGGWTETIYPYALKKDPTDFYCYSNGCSNPDPFVTPMPSSSNIADAYNFTKFDRSNIFAYININTNILSIGILHDKADRTIPNVLSGQVEFSFSGIGWNMASVIVSDDNNPMGEGYELIRSDPTFGGDWSWGTCCTDGGMMSIAPLNTGWNMTIDPNFQSGLSEWFAKIPGPTEMGEYIPNLTDNLVITYIPN